MLADTPGNTPRERPHEPEDVTFGPASSWPDPGRGGPLAVVLAVMCAGAVILFQNTGVLAPPPAPPSGSVTPGTISNPTELVGRIAVRLFAWVNDEGGGAAAAGGTGSMYVDQIAGSAATPEDFVRAAIVAGEIAGADEALARLEIARAEIAQAVAPAPVWPLADPPSDAMDEEIAAAAIAARAVELAGDIALLERVYRMGPGAAGPVSLNDSERDRLVAHHGFFGEAALAFGLDPSDPARAELRSGALLLVSVLVLVSAVLMFGLLAGVGVLIWLAVGFAMRKRQMLMPVPRRGGSVYLESFALFAGGFAGLQLLSYTIDVSGVALPSWYGAAAFLAQWLLTPLAFWPLVRGMSWERFKGTVGLHGGAGVLREIGAGVIGYLACIPLYGVGVLLAIVSVVIADLFGGSGGEGVVPPTNPILELFTGSPLQIGLLFLMAVVWAPLTEELIFRGALHRHLRSWSGVAVASGLVAIVFGLFHSYGVLVVWPVVMLGIGFSLIREWRGSLIACFTAHAIHNGLVLCVLTVLVRSVS